MDNSGPRVPFGSEAVYIYMGIYKELLSCVLNYHKLKEHNKSTYA